LLPPLQPAAIRSKLERSACEPAELAEDLGDMRVMLREENQGARRSLAIRFVREVLLDEV